MTRKQDRSRDLQPQSTTPLEWAAATAGAMIVCGMIGFLIWYGIVHADSYPVISVRPVAAATPVATGFRVDFSARNDSSATAAEVRIEGELRVGREIIERNVAVLDYLPGFSERRGGLFFRRDPRGGELTLRATGYQEP